MRSSSVTACSTVEALPRRTGNNWRYVTHAIGPTDVAWARWWKEYKAPRGIFDLVESGYR